MRSFEEYLKESQPQRDHLLSEIGSIACNTIENIVDVGDFSEEIATLMLKLSLFVVRGEFELFYAFLVKEMEKSS